MRAWTISATIVAVIAVGVLGVAATLIVPGGISARTEPSRLEARVALGARRLALRSARRESNPVKATPEAVAEGMDHFADHCASCHANDGSGQTELGQHLYPRVPDMRLAGTQDLTDGELFAIIEDGVRFTGMPAWGDKSEESQAASWKLVRFIRHLPNLEPAERVRMDELNPKGPEDREEEQDEENFLNGDAGTPKTRAHHH